MRLAADPVHSASLSGELYRPHQRRLRGPDHEQGLGFSSGVFGLGAGIFFIGYSLFQVPANVILERIGAQRWIFSIMAVWGLLAAANALVTTPTGFYLVRFSLGVAEAGFTPRHVSLSNLLASQARSCARHGPIPDRASAILRYWWAAFELYNGDGRHGRPARLAMAVFVGRGAGIVTRVRRAQIFAGWPATRLLAHPNGKGNNCWTPGG